MNRQESIDFGRRRKTSVAYINSESRTDNGTYSRKPSTKIMRKQHSFSTARTPRLKLILLKFDTHKNIFSDESILYLLEQHLRKHSWTKNQHSICTICQSIMEGSFVKGTCHWTMQLYKHHMHNRIFEIDLHTLDIESSIFFPKLSKNMM